MEKPVQVIKEVEKTVEVIKEVCDTVAAVLERESEEAGRGGAGKSSLACAIRESMRTCRWWWRSPWR